MANREHLEILKQGVKAWNKWRREYPNIHPDLKDEYLLRADLRSVNLSDANLGNAKLTGAYLNGADLRRANLSGTCLRYTTLFSTDLSHARLNGSDLTGATLAYTVFANNDLSEVKGLEEVWHHS